MSLLPDSPPVQPVSSQPMLLDQELVRLGRNATFNLAFPPPLEQQFRDWLQEKAMRFLRQYIWILAGLYVLLVLATVPKIYLFTDLNAYPGDEFVYWAMVGALGVVTVFFAFFVSQPKFDKWFFFYSPAVDVTMLVSTSLGMIAFQDPYNARLSMAIVVVCFSIVFATGMQRLLPCMLIALATFFITMVASHGLGLQAGFWSYAMQFSVVVSGMILLCHFMMRAHRVDFLQSELLLHDKQRLLELSAELAELSERDSLTGLANRRRFDALLVSEWERAMRQPLPLAVLFVDVDFFKSYNDHKGHQAGDACLAAVAKILEESLRRPADLVARYGGEEFIVLLPDTEPDGALELAMFILERLRKCAMPHETSPFKIVTASIGLAAMPPLGRSGPSGLLAAADRALYAAKAAGRNRIEVAVPDASTGELRLPA